MVPGWVVLVTGVATFAAGAWLTWDVMQGKVELNRMTEPDTSPDPDEQERKDPELILLRAEIRAMQAEIDRHLAVHHGPGPWQRLKNWLKGTWVHRES